MIEKSQNIHYTKHHPRWHRVSMPIFWWVHKWSSIRFITRELTSVFVAGYAIILLLLVRALSQGPEAYATFWLRMKTPASIILHGIALFFLIFHSVTWFNLAPKALVLHIGPKRIPGALIAISNYVAWIFVSLVIAWILLR